MLPFAALVLIGSVIWDTFETQPVSNIPNTTPATVKGAAQPTGAFDLPLSTDLYEDVKARSGAGKASIFLVHIANASEKRVEMQ